LRAPRAFVGAVLHISPVISGRLIGGLIGGLEPLLGTAIVVSNVVMAAFFWIGMSLSSRWVGFVSLMWGCSGAPSFVDADEAA
jgi:hypothetical protein